MNSRRLYRCRQDRKIAGVAAGMAEYLEIDPTVIRIAWILSAFLGGFTILLYVILAFIVPVEPIVMLAQDTSSSSDVETPAGPGGTPAAHWPTRPGAPHVHDVQPADDRPGRAGTIFGVLLVVFGGIALIGEVIPSLAMNGLIGPALILALGIAFLVGSTRRPASNT